MASRMMQEDCEGIVSTSFTINVTKAVRLIVETYPKPLSKALKMAMAVVRSLYGAISVAYRLVMGVIANA